MPDRGLPAPGELSPLLGFPEGAVADLVSAALLDPLQEFLSRPGKQFRGQLVRLAFRLSDGPPIDVASGERWCARGAEMLEQIHAGSLVVDDVQDDSRERRGRPTLHREHGVSLAINAGNWLYFWPMERIRTWDLPADREVRVYQVCLDSLLKAHFGQALDVGVPIDELAKTRVGDVALASLELKTGALTSMATRLGAAIAGASSDRSERLGTFGRKFGVALQMLDDIGNFTGKQGAADPKRWEDLRLRRPSWIWAVAAESSDAEYDVFRGGVKALPDEGPVLEWAKRTGLVARAREAAESYLKAALDELEGAVRGEPAWTELRQLATALAGAYR